MLACSRLTRTTACPHVRAGMNVLDFPEGLRPKATVVNPWYVVYSEKTLSEKRHPCKPRSV